MLGLNLEGDGLEAEIVFYDRNIDSLEAIGQWPSYRDIY